jgi:hypothetical protein
MTIEILNENTGEYVDITGYIAFGGLKWQRNDVESPEAGRTLDGIMHRGRVGTKIRLDVTCHLLKAPELATVLNLIYPEYITVRYDDPMLGNVVKKMYSNNNPASYCILKPDGTEYWSEITFPLIEV